MVQGQDNAFTLNFGVLFKSVGQVEVPIEKLNTQQLTDSRYPVISRVAKEATLRLKTKYQCVDILPLAIYQPLIEVELEGNVQNIQHMFI